MNYFIMEDTILDNFAPAGRACIACLAALVSMCSVTAAPQSTALPHLHKDGSANRLWSAAMDPVLTELMK